MGFGRYETSKVRMNLTVFAQKTSRNVQLKPGVVSAQEPDGFVKPARTGLGLVAEDLG